ncbi:hypothetical protein AKJ36_00915 [candidate division MSBL1 archaeon SCGC-AAA259I07]|uniref:Uncharacterized protein n=1 Tax=candidate division MSBL1 archaeon SCGC-AAA259I07 TaxID=1698266 RepID=A0A133UMK3_9EURY|nr:hypothetical protein AKJ36_00915 [candidate division MSBL1 archaeon SCGC-AAA259I07]
MFLIGKLENLPSFYRGRIFFHSNRKITPPLSNSEPLKRIIQKPEVDTIIIVLVSEVEFKDKGEV